MNTKKNLLKVSRLPQEVGGIAEGEASKEGLAAQEEEGEVAKEGEAAEEEGKYGNPTTQLKLLPKSPTRKWNGL